MPHDRTPPNNRSFSNQAPALNLSDEQRETLKWFVQNDRPSREFCEVLLAHANGELTAADDVDGEGEANG